MYFIALAVILGAHLNASVQALWPAPLRRRGRLVPGVTGSGAVPSQVVSPPTGSARPVRDAADGGAHDAPV
jgi:membrane protein